MIINKSQSATNPYYYGSYFNLVPFIQKFLMLPYDALINYFSFLFYFYFRQLSPGFVSIPLSLVSHYRVG